MQHTIQPIVLSILATIHGTFLVYLIDVDLVDGYTIDALFRGPVTFVSMEVGEFYASPMVDQTKVKEDLWKLL